MKQAVVTCLAIILIGSTATSPALARGGGFGGGGGHFGGGGGWGYGRGG